MDITKQNIYINSNGSKIKVESYFQNNNKCVIIFPPHPKHGGSTDSATVKTLNKSFLANSFSTLCVQLENDQNDEKYSKITTNILSWLDNNFPVLTEFWVAGLSFGSWLAVNMVMRRPEITGFVALGMPTKLYDFSFLLPCSVPGILIQGENDKSTDIPYLINIASTLKKRMGDLFHYELIEDADHNLNRLSDLTTIYNILSKNIHKICSTNKSRELEYLENNESLTDRKHNSSIIQEEEDFV